MRTCDRNLLTIALADIQRRRRRRSQRSLGGLQMTHVTRTSTVAVADQTVVRSRTPTTAQQRDGHGYRTLPGASGGSVCSTWRQSSNGWNDVDNNNVDARRGRSDDRTAAELQSKLVFVDDDVDDVDRPNTTTNELRPSATPARLPCRCHSTGRQVQRPSTICCSKLEWHSMGAHTTSKATDVAKIGTINKRW